MTNDEHEARLRGTAAKMSDQRVAFRRLRAQAEADPILIQHQTFIDVMFDFQRSRWPWVRWVAERMQEEIICRLAARDARNEAGSVANSKTD